MMVVLLTERLVLIAVAAAVRLSLDVNLVLTLIDSQVDESGLQ